MIIWGWKAREKTVGTGVFFCPQCRTQAGYTYQRVSRIFTLYFIPLFPTSTLSEYVHCGICRSNLRPDVLRLTPEQIAQASTPWTCAWCGNRNPPAEAACVACKKSRSGPPPLPLTKPEVVNVVQHGADTHGELHVRQEWINEKRAIEVDIQQGFRLKLRLDPVMTAGANVRAKGHAPDGKGDLYLCIRIRN